MTSGALSIDGPGRSAVGTAMTSETSGAVGPTAPKPMEQFVPPNTRWYTGVHPPPFLLTSPLSTRFQGLPAAWATMPVAVRTSRPVSDNWVPVDMTGGAVMV